MLFHNNRRWRCRCRSGYNVVICGRYFIAGNSLSYTSLMGIFFVNRVDPKVVTFLMILSSDFTLFFTEKCHKKVVLSGFIILKQGMLRCLACHFGGNPSPIDVYGLFGIVVLNKFLFDVMWVDLRMWPNAKEIVMWKAYFFFMFLATTLVFSLESFSF